MEVILPLRASSLMVAVVGHLMMAPGYRGAQVAVGVVLPAQALVFALGARLLQVKDIKEPML
jgi:hypothetical protein